MFDLVRESALLGVVGSVGATTAIFILQAIRRWAL